MITPPNSSPTSSPTLPSTLLPSISFAAQRSRSVKISYDIQDRRRGANSSPPSCSPLHRSPLQKEMEYDYSIDYDYGLVDELYGAGVAY